MDAKEHFWGTELSKGKNTVKWAPQLESASGGDDLQQILEVKQAVLGTKATKGERNVVEVTAKDFKGTIIKLPVLSLELGKEEQCQLSLSFNPPVTFKLINGTGPIYLSGRHLVEVESLGYDDSMFEEAEDEEEEEEEEEESEEEESEDEKEESGASPDLPKSKKRAATTPVEKPKKVAKLDLSKTTDEDDEDEDSDEEDSDEDDDSDSDLTEEMKKQLFEDEAMEEDDEDDESYEEDSDEEDDDSDEDEDDDEDDEEDSEDEEEESPVKKPAQKQVNGNAGKAKAKAKTPAKKEDKSQPTPKQAKGSVKKAEQGKPTPKSDKTKGKATPDAKTPKSKVWSMDEVKADISKSPALPKKENRFENFVRNKYKVDDKEKIKTLWAWHQKTNIKS